MTIQHHDPASRPPSLRDISIDLKTRPVIDELDAMRLPQATLSDYAGFAATPISIVAMTRRAAHHAGQIKRFLALINPKDPVSMLLHLDQIQALLRLNGAAVIAISLMPAHSGADRHAKRQQGHAVLEALSEPARDSLRNVISTAFGLIGSDSAEIADDVISYASPMAEEKEPGGATVHRLGEGASLKSYCDRPPEIAALGQQAQRHGAMAKKFGEKLATRRLSRQEREFFSAATAGARLQQHIALAALALSPALPAAGSALAPVNDGIGEAEAQQAAALALAIAIGHRQRGNAVSHP
jgi:hypothetical protein